jgi:hypothetical protein
LDAYRVYQRTQGYRDHNDAALAQITKQAEAGAVRERTMFDLLHG